jgi:serine/threonine protein kinase
LVAGRYRLRGSLGHGGMGVVWHAWDEYLQRDVAIKEIHVRGAASVRESDPAVRRALREARAAAALRHPGIVTVHDVVTDDGRPWIVMELIEGRSLAELLRDDGPVAEHRAARIGIQVLSALDAAHQRGILHRDVKPGNIMLDGDRAVLTDFSIAAIDGATALTGTDQLIGSPEYIAPERIDGHEATNAADLWGLGVTLYSSLVGHSPFHRTDTPATLAAIIARDPEPHPRTGRLWPVIEGLLRKNPADRLTATAATALLTEVAAPVAAPTSDTVPAMIFPVSETRIADHAAQVTVVPETIPNTRTAPPVLPPAETELTVTPTEITADPVIIRPRPDRRRVIGMSTFVVALIAIVATVIWLTTRHQPNSPATLPQFKLYEENLGFSISVPQDWTRSASGVSELSDVIWQGGQQPDPKIGALQVQVRRDNTKPNPVASSYLADKDRSENASSENINYQRIRLDAAELEYTTGQRDGTVHYHFHTWAFATGSKPLYVLTFSLFSSNEQALRAQWEAAQPTLEKIRETFHVS